MATAKAESNFTHSIRESFAYSKSELQANWGARGRALFTDEWIGKNLSFKANRDGKLVVKSKDWHKVANRIYARDGLNGRNGNEASGDGFKYRGRGFSQITHRNNYATAGSALGLDLLNSPDLALQFENSVDILIYGMKSGLFTTKSLSSYLTQEVEDYRLARQIINGLNKADPIAETAKRYEKILQSWRPFKGVIAYDTSEQDFIELGPENNLLYAGWGPRVGESPRDYFDGGLGEDTINFQGTDGDYGVSGEEYHPGAMESVWAVLGNTDRQGLPGSNEFPIFPEIQGFENVIGSSRDDVLVGSDLRNDIYGAKGDDFIRGGAGSDTLTGGSGRDLFSYARTEDSRNTASRDVITDFNPKEDRIDLYYIDADERWFSNEAFKFIGQVAKPSDVLGGQLGYVVTGEGSVVYANINFKNDRPQDDQLSDLRFDLRGVSSLLKTCFVL